ncbi:hypothetical protein [Paenibacillus monticola]|uniref:PKD/Chitinase domain-containing protein n=1 Tax=Paenibacillus monticola TaxID=2666075 RepID=A0A7X2H333_9BACL|nr:hypothetical protein [Paenibacillus monticola]MRN51813.1 hypothetical protein [Paenibacillus monticola]
MKRVLNFLIILILLTTTLVQAKVVDAAETKSAIVAIPANTGLIGDDYAAKSFLLDLPGGVSTASINVSTLKYTGNNALNGGITIENGKIKLKLNGVANTKTLNNLVGYRGSYESYYYTNPSNSIWRYSDGRRWQINEYDEAKDALKTKDLPAEDSDTPSARPPRVVVSAAPAKDMEYLKWYDKAQTNIIDSKYILSATITPVFYGLLSSSYIKEPPKFKNGKVIVNYAIPFFVDADGKTVEQQYTNQNADASHPLVGHAQGRKYEVDTYYYYTADAKVPSYSYSGSISFNYTPISTPTLDGNVSVVNPSPNPTQNKGKDIPVSLKIKGDLLAYTSSSNIEEWIFYAKETGSNDVKQKKDYNKVLNSTQTFDNFVIPLAKFKNGDFEQEYTLIVTVRFSKPIVTDNGTVTSLSKTMKATVGVGNTPIDPPPTNNNKPPVAVLDVPDEVMAGEDFLVYGKNSYDTDGKIVNYDYVAPGTIDKVTGEFGFTWYPLSALGRHTVRLTVTDNGDLTGYTSAKVNVVQPEPVAVIKVRGTKKQNRKVTLVSTSRSPEHYPIDETKTQWTITPVSGGTAADIKYSGTLTGMDSKDVLFKKPGTYEATITVTNTAGFSDTASMTFDIVPDEAPVVYISVPNKVFRDPANGSQAAVGLSDMSFSPDFDFIDHRTWEYRRDSDNDGSFDDESWTIFNNGNETNFNLNLSQVGRYEVKMTATEKFDQPTIDEFVNAADRRSTDSYSSKPAQPLTERLVEVYNRAPVVDWSW